MARLITCIGGGHRTPGSLARAMTTLFNFQCGDGVAAYTEFSRKTTRDEVVNWCQITRAQNLFLAGFPRQEEELETLLNLDGQLCTFLLNGSNRQEGGVYSIQTPVCMKDAVTFMLARLPIDGRTKSGLIHQVRRGNLSRVLDTFNRVRTTGLSGALQPT